MARRSRPFSNIFQPRDFGVCCFEMKLKKWGLAGVSVVVSLLLLEGGLREFTVFPVHESKKNLIEDPRLGFRMNPGLKDIDANGFRNPAAVAQADLVALGDSHTYGYNVSSEETWPRLLGRRLGLSVYNFGVGSYGLLQYYALMDDALALHPRYIVVGLYLHNDVRDICSQLELPYWNKFVTDRRIQIPAVTKCLRQGETAEAPPWWKRTAVGSAYAALVAEPLADKWILFQKRYGSALVVKDGLNDTIIPLKRLDKHARYVDLRSPKIIGLAEFSKLLLLEMKARADQEGVGFGVLLIPSKENVFYDYLLERKYQLPEVYHQLVRDERALNDDFESFFTQNHVPFADARPYLLKKLAAVGNVYPEWRDSHPRKVGYEAYADAALDGLGLAKFLPAP